MAATEAAEEDVLLAVEAGVAPKAVLVDSVARAEVKATAAVAVVEEQQKRVARVDVAASVEKVAVNRKVNAAREMPVHQLLLAAKEQEQ
ncbi:hypothetical protein D3C76_1350940 [compost metagenome]